MLLIPTYLAPSPIHGTGVYAATRIPKGTIIWRYQEPTDWKMTPHELARFPEPFRSRLKAFSYMDEDSVYVLCGDNAKFMNHSDEPNCDDTTDHCTFALRDITPNEELTCDYRSFDMESRSRTGPLYTSENGIELQHTI